MAVSQRRLDEKELAEQLRQMMVHCVGFSGDELSESRKQAYDYYFQRPRGDEIPGRSTIVSSDLSSMVEGNLAHMVGPLTNKRIAEFCAYDEADEEQAQLESDCVHAMIFKRQNGFIEITQAIKDALLQRNCVVKVYIDHRTHKQHVRRSNVDIEVVTDVLDQIGKTDVHSYDPKTGDLSATVTKETRKFIVEALAPENFIVPKNWHRQDLFNIPFCAERHLEPRSTLIERGFPRSKVRHLRRFNSQYSNGAEARLPKTVSPWFNAVDKSQEYVEWYEAYIRMDAGDGTSELRRICFSDSYILEDEVADMICYATGVTIINPHTFIGISLHDKLKSVQDGNTALNRALFDNLNATNKNRTAHFDGVVEEQDLLDGRINGSIRVRPGVVQDVRAAVAAFSVPDTSANILANIEHMRRTRSELGGASLDMATGQVQLNERVGSQGLDRAYSVMEAIAEFMVRIVAHTLVRNMYLVAHETLRTQWIGQISFKRGKTWLVQEPSKWPVRDEVNVNMGASPGERARIALVLEKLMEKQAALAANGMEDILVDVHNYYNALIEWLRISDVELPEKYALNPNSDRAKQAFEQRSKAKAAQQQKQDAMIQQAVALEQVRTALEKYRTDVETQFKYYQAVLNAQIEEAKLATSGVVDLRKAQLTANAQAQKGKENGPDTKSESSEGTEGKSAARGSTSEE